MICRTFGVAGLLLALVGCGGGGSRPDPTLSPTPTAGTSGASSTTIDSLLAHADTLFRHGKWNDAEVELERLLLEMGAGDSRVARVRFQLAESRFASGEHLQAAREFRRVSDEMPSDPLAPDALLRVGDVYTDLWRRPELDPTYGQTALQTYQEVQSRYPESPAARQAQTRVSDLQARFAAKQYKSAMYYMRLKAYDSAILYLKDLLASYPRAPIAPDALLQLIKAYRALGYQEDVQETCGYLRRFHPDTPGAAQACPVNPAAGGSS